MKINNINISNFKAKLMDRNIKSASFEVFNYWPDDIDPIIQDNKRHKYKELNLTLDIICNDTNELEIMKSNLVKELKVCTMKFDDIKYNYIGFCDDTPAFSYIMPGNETMTVKLLVYCTSDEKTENLNRVNSKTINVSGNLNTPAIVEIIPSIDIIDIKLEGLSDDPIIIRNLKQGQKVIINGEDGTILENGINKFDDTDMWDFPRLVPRANIIKLSKNSCDVTIKYKSRWI